MERARIKFGVAGNSASFYAEGGKTTNDAAQWCAKRGIDVFEYSFGRGVNLQEETAKSMGRAFAECGVEMTVHAPYFINFSNPSDEMIEKSFGYVLQSIKKANDFGGDRVVVHPASQGKVSREEAVVVAKANLVKMAEILAEKNENHVKVCLETMGKLGQIGTVDEIIDFCGISDDYYPCMDFGHINAREQGVLKTSADYEAIIKKMLDRLPKEKVEFMHVHFSKIRYGKNGEINHVTFEDTEFGPEFPPLAEVLYKYDLKPCIICESDGTQAEDTITMKNMYFSIANK